jgi:hypothetical protein
VAKKDAQLLRDIYLDESVGECAHKLKTDKEKALKAIKHAEESKMHFHQINGMLGHKRAYNPLTQVDIID